MPFLQRDFQRGLPHRLDVQKQLIICRSDTSWVTSCGGIIMLETIAIVLIVLWVLGLISSFSMGGLINVLLVVAAMLLLTRVSQERQI